MRASILSIGDELTTGAAADTNAAWLARGLGAHAVRVAEFRVVPDDRTAIAEALGQLAARSDLLFVTGGLGPTADDLTRQALGDVVAPGRPLVLDDDGVAHLRRWFSGRPGRMPASNEIQARRPEGTRLIANPHGTAMGISASVGSCRVFVMPGPPREMKPMFGQLLPTLDLGGDRTTGYELVHEFGLGESAAGERLGELTDRDREPRVGLTHSASTVTARIRATGTPEQVRTALASAREAILERWSPYAYGTGDDTLASAAGGLLRACGRRLVTAESCTGGLLGALIVDVPGSSEYYGGGWVTYTNELKTSCLGVPAGHFAAHGAVSEPVAAAMAEGALRVSGADEALAVTGIAGPAGGSEAKRVGTVYIGLARRGKDAAVVTVVRHFRFPGGRSIVRERAARSALQVLRFALLDVGPDVELLWERRP